MARLEGKVALVTGGASMPGLGSATAARFAREGAFVYVSDRDGAGAEHCAATIRAAGGQARAITHDVASEADWDRVVASIDGDHGMLDVVVNNAGISILRPIEQLTGEDWLAQERINVGGVFFGTQRAVAAMRRAGRGGSIINVSSVVGLVGVRGCAAYAATKGGVRLLTKTVAIECAAEGIRVNSVHPGMIDTNMLGFARLENAEVHAALLAGIPMGRLGMAEDIANMNLFLASDEARYITGAEFVVDGGMTAQ